MAAIKITDNVFSVGVQNPDLEIFDIVMPTRFGTSYNSFLVKGETKTALVETSHAEFFDEYKANIAEVADPASIDYIVVNHTEPDHSGALAALLGVCPNAQIVCTAVAANYLKNITNRADLNVRVVKEGETLDLGGLTLKFIVAPLLHWPDTMMTYCPEEKVLFPCDFLGAHYSFAPMFDAKVRNLDDYRSAFKDYYDAIFGPFKPFVLAGLAKISALDIKYVCNSHGPVLTKAGQLDYAIQKYREWSAPVKSAVKRVPVFYCSAYGCTAALAAKIRDGVLSVLPSAECKTYNIIDFDLATLAAELNGSNAFAIGSPTLNADAVPPVWNLIASIDAINIKKRPVAVFGSYGWSGEAVPALIARLTALKLNVVGEGLKACFVPSEAELAKAFELGAMLAQSIT